MFVENPFGLSDEEAHGAEQREHRPRVARPTRITPRMQILKPALPKEAMADKPRNTIPIPKTLLRRINRNTTDKSDDLSRLMLESIASSVLSYDAATNVVQTVLSDGLGIEATIDESMPEVIHQLSRLEVIFFFLKRMRLPKEIKNKFMSELVLHNAKLIAEKVNKVDRSKSFSDTLQQMSKQLEGYLVEKGKTPTHSVEDTPKVAPRSSKFASTRRRPR